MSFENERKHTITGSPRSRISWIATIVGIVLWSLITWVGYLALDALLIWLATNSGALVETGKNVSSALGANEVSVAINTVDAAGWAGQLIWLLQAVLLPLVLIVWIIGGVTLIVLPRIFSKIASIIIR